LLTACLVLVLLATAASASAEPAPHSTGTTAPHIATTAPHTTAPRTATTAPHSTGATKSHFQHESVKEFEKQLSAGQIEAATFNKKAHTLHLSLKDGRHLLVSYSSPEEPQLVAKLRAKGAPAQVEKSAKKAASKAKAVHHTLRYIAGGIVVILIGVLVAVLLVNRRRRGQGVPEPSGDSG